MGAQYLQPMALTEIKGFINLAQMGQYPAVWLLEVVEQESKNRIDDETPIFAGQATKTITPADGCLEKGRKIAWEV